MPSRVLKLFRIGNMNINIVSDESSWFSQYIPVLLEELQKQNHSTNWTHDLDKILDADITFFIGCFKIAKSHQLARSKHNLVVHESALPAGKGWSPVSWQVLEGKNEIPVCLLDASEKVDSGNIYLRSIMNLTGSELVDEIRIIQAKVTFDLCRTFVSNFPHVLEKGSPQVGQSSSYTRRTAKDSQIDLDKSINDQFNLFRIVDNDNYPAYFIKNGQKYILKIYKSEE